MNIQNVKRVVTDMKLSHLEAYEIIGRMINMVAVYHTPKHKKDCTCHGCYLLKVVSSAFTESQMEIILKWN